MSQGRNPLGLFICFKYITDATSDVSDIIEYIRPEDYNIEPNSRYNNGESLGAWTSISDVDKFFTKYNHDNGYKSSIIPLRLGDYVTIQDGTYNTQWMIAGFDMEHNQIAADGTVYDNGYGICMVPRDQLTTGKWNTSDGTTGGYISSYIHTTTLSNIVNNLQNVLGSHIVQRNVLLSSSTDGNKSNAYTWTTAHATIMSGGQFNGIFGDCVTKYDDGEANYKLPIFNFADFKTGFTFWTRGPYGGSVFIVDSNGNISNRRASESIGVRPLIYIR